MSEKDGLQITDAEWEVMQSVWAVQEQTPGEIIERVQPLRDRSHRTIRTLLNRLVEKGAVKVRSEGSRRLYSAAVSRQACIREAAKSFGERFFGGSVSSLLMHFVESESLSASEAQELRERLDEIAPTSVAKRGKHRRSKSQVNPSKRSGK